MPLVLQEVRTFPRTVEFTEPSKEDPKRNLVSKFDVVFRILEASEQQELLQAGVAMVKKLQRTQQTGEALEDGDDESLNHALASLDKILVSVSGIHDRDGKEIPSEEAIALIRRFPDICEAILAEYNLAMKSSGNVRAKNSKR